MPSFQPTVLSMPPLSIPSLPSSQPAISFASRSINPADRSIHTVIQPCFHPLIHTSPSRRMPSFQLTALSIAHSSLPSLGSTHLDIVSITSHPSKRLLYRYAPVPSISPLYSIIQPSFPLHAIRPADCYDRDSVIHPSLHSINPATLPIAFYPSSKPLYPFLRIPPVPAIHSSSSFRLRSIHPPGLSISAFVPSTVFMWRRTNDVLVLERSSVEGERERATSPARGPASQLSYQHKPT